MAIHAGKVPSEDTLQQRARRLGASLEETLFAESGAVAEAARAMGSFLSRPAMRELTHLEVYHDNVIDAGAGLLKSDKGAIMTIIHNIAQFMDATTAVGGQDAETNNAIAAATASIVGSEDDMKGRVSAYHRLLGLTRRRVADAIARRGDVMSQSGKGRWKRRGKADYSNRYGDTVKGIIDNFLHDQGTPDNSSHRGEIKVPIDIAEDGTVTFDLHPPLIIPDADTLLRTLTGRDHKQKKVQNSEGLWQYPEVSDPHPAWADIMRHNKERTKPLVLSTKLLRDCYCDCMGKSRTYKCADKKRFAFEQMLALFYKARQIWHRTCPGPDGLCDCGCDYEAVKFWAQSPANSLTASMCPPDEVPEFALPEYDPVTAQPCDTMRVPKLHKLACHEGTCSECGWDTVFGG